MAGVTIRTLHHYDQLGLLVPGERTDKGYRLYTRSDLFKLQQILFYKHLGYDLKEICKVINDKSFDLITSLRSHRTALKNKIESQKKLIHTIDKTIKELKNKEGMITAEEMYQGFAAEEIEAIRAEANERWPDETSAVEEKIQQMSKMEWADIKEEEKEICLWLGNLMHRSADSEAVQKVVQLHFNHISRFYEVTEERYRGLAKMYVEDERFEKHYNDVKAGLADFLSQAMLVFSDNGLKV